MAVNFAKLPECGPPPISEAFSVKDVKVAAGFSIEIMAAMVEFAKLAAVQRTKPLPKNDAWADKTSERDDYLDNLQEVCCFCS
jgi:hypothetical protein